MFGGDFVPGIKGNPEEIRCERLSKGHWDHRAGLWKQRRNGGTSSSEGVPHLLLLKLLGAAIQVPWKEFHCKPEWRVPEGGRLPLPCSAPRTRPPPCPLLWVLVGWGCSHPAPHLLGPLCGHTLSPSRVWLSVILWTVVRQAPLSMGFPRQQYRSGLPYPPPGNLPDPGIEPASLVSPALAAGFFISTHLGSPLSPWGRVYKGETHRSRAGVGEIRMGSLHRMVEACSLVPPSPSSFRRKILTAWGFWTHKQLKDGKPAAFKKKQHKYSL